MADVSYIIALRDRVSGVARRMQMSLKGIQTQAQAAGSVLTKLTLVTGVAAGAMFKYGSEIEKTQVAFNTMTGSAEKGKALFSELTEFANSTPFSNRDVNKNAQVLLAFGQKAGTVTGTLGMLGDVAAGDSEKLRLVTLAFSQIQATGKLMGQDLLQLVNAGFNPLQEISEKTGVSMAVLKDKMSKGQISADMVTKAFKSATGEGGRFHNLTEKMSKTMSGKFSTALGKGQFFLGELGLAMKDLFVPLLDGAIKAIDVMLKYKNRIAQVLPSVGIFVSVLGGLSAAFVVLNAVMNANPIFLLITMLAAGSAAIHFLMTQMEGWDKQWKVLATSLELIWDGMGLRWKLMGDSMSVQWEGTLDNIVKSYKKAQNMMGFLSDEQYKKDILRLHAGDQARRKTLKKTTDSIRINERLLKGLSQTNYVKLKGAGDEADPFGLGGGGSPTLTPALDFGGELDKLKAEGVVSGNINTFNVNIGELKGIENFSTNNIQEGAQNVGRSVTDAILNALADVKVN